MLKKRISLLVIVFMLMMGTVSAASLHGDFEGHPIVKLTSNGVDLVVEDTPAMNYNGRTMVPVYMLRQLGADVKWDQKTQTVDVSLSKGNTTVTSVTDVVKLSKELKEYDIKYVEFVSNGDSFHQLSFYYERTIDELLYNNVDTFGYLLALSANTEATSLRILDITGNEFSVLADFVREYKNGKITIDQLTSHFRINGQAAPQQMQNNPQQTTNIELSLYSNDRKTYLGKLTTNEFDTDSVFNNLGSYGSELSATSIWNQLGTYGSELSSNSAFNNLATKPPIIVSNGEVIGYVSTNSLLPGAISPYSLKEWLKNKGH